MARLNLKLADGNDAWIEVGGGPDDAIERFIQRTDEWIPVGGSRTAYVRRDQIVRVFV